MSSKFGVYKFLVFSEILVHSFKPSVLDYTNRECEGEGEGDDENEDEVSARKCRRGNVGESF